MRRALFLATTALASIPLAKVARADDPGSLVTPAPTDDTEPPQGDGPAKGHDNAFLPTARVEGGPLVDKPAERRSGVALGFTYGAGLGSSSGYPNQSALIGDPDDYSASGLMGGSGGSVFVMGALSDYLNFGFWFGATTLANEKWRSTGQGGGFRVEVFPLFALGRGFRDLGAFAVLGIGATALERKSTDTISNGLESFLGAGVFYEFWLFRGLGGHFALGPSLEYDAIVTEPMERHGALLGARFLWYGGR
jgi:hypothetical protein